MAYERSIARRVFAKELNESSIYYKEGTDDMSPNVMITPTGCKCSRVLIMGALTAKENISENDVYYRCRVSDPTGVFTVFSGEYQVAATQALNDIEPPAFVAIIGKPYLFKPKGADGKEDPNAKGFVNVRPEFIAVVDKQAVENWNNDTAIATLERLEGYKVVKSAPEGEREYAADGDPEIHAIARAIYEYDSGEDDADTIGVYKSLLHDVLLTQQVKAAGTDTLKMDVTPASETPNTEADGGDPEFGKADARKTTKKKK
jgi:RPA family protein